MESSDDDVSIVEFDMAAHSSEHINPSASDTTNYMALHHEARMTKENPNYIERSVRVPRAPKLKLNSQLLLAPHGLALLAKQCRQLRLNRKQGSEGIQLTRIIQLYDAWARQLCPGYDLEVFYNKIEKIGGERVVKEQTEALITGRNVDDLDALNYHTSHTEQVIRQHRSSVLQKRYDDGEGDDVELEIEEIPKTKFNGVSAAVKTFDESNDKHSANNVMEGDFAEPEGLEEVDFDEYDE
jgi:hypothetical protein